MDAAGWLDEHASLQVDHTSFACLEGCGFCCTYPPQVTEQGFQSIQRATGLTRMGVGPQGEARLPLQGGCGGCVLLEDRTCQAYELRPRHCRLFPFHVYFGRHVEVYANRVCPGLDPEPQPPGTRELSVAIAQATAGVAPEELAACRDQALEVHGRFEQNCRDAGTWQDPEAAREAAQAAPRVTGEGWQEALAPFQQEALELLPTMVLPGPGFPWRIWRLDGGRLEHLRFEEDGSTEQVATSPAPERPAELSPASERVYRRLLGLECFLGSAFDLVDASGYSLPVDEAVRELADVVAAGLGVREALLEAEGLACEPSWLAAAYEPEFFDLPTVGGWL